MRRFTRLYMEIDATTATSEKVALMEAYFREVPPADAAVALYYLAGERPKRLLPTKVLRDAVLEATRVPAWLLDECYTAVGDFSETAALLLPDSPGSGDGAAAGGGEIGLAEVFGRFVLPLGTLGAAAQRALLFEAWRIFGSDERLVFHKIVRGGFRVGVQRAMVVQALAAATGLPREEMAHRLTGGVTPTGAWFEALVGSEGGGASDRPYPFYLASPLEAPAESLGDIGQWRVEEKFDGIRAQLIRRQGQTRLWSRGEEPIGEQFPEIVAAARALPDGTVLDGEVLIWRGDRPLAFNVLQTRLNRKGAPVDRGLFDDDHAVFVAFDAIEDAGVDVRQEPLRERRARLERVLASPGLDRSTIRAIDAVAAGSWEELARVRLGSRERGVEGLMLKHLESAYQVGRSRAADGKGWWKWKVDPLSVDAVLVYAQGGSGRRAGLHTDCTFALWESAAPGARLVPFAKAYSGLTQDEIERLDDWIVRHTVAKRGPVREVEPVHVFEIGFEGLAESTRHKAGIAVRFPRILKWRTDKTPRDADTMEVLREMLRGLA